MSASSSLQFSLCFRGDIDTVISIINDILKDMGPYTIVIQVDPPGEQGAVNCTISLKRENITLEQITLLINRLAPLIDRADVYKVEITWAK